MDVGAGAPGGPNGTGDQGRQPTPQRNPSTRRRDGGRARHDGGRGGRCPAATTTSRTSRVLFRGMAQRLARSSRAQGPGRTAEGSGRSNLGPFVESEERPGLAVSGRVGPHALIPPLNRRGSSSNRQTKFECAPNLAGFTTMRCCLFLLLSRIVFLSEGREDFRPLPNPEKPTSWRSIGNAKGGACPAFPTGCVCRDCPQEDHSFTTNDAAVPFRANHGQLPACHVLVSAYVRPGDPMPQVRHRASAHVLRPRLLSFAHGLLQAASGQSTKGLSRSTTHAHRARAARVNDVLHETNTSIADKGRHGAEGGGIWWGRGFLVEAWP